MNKNKTRHYSRDYLPLQLCVEKKLASENGSTFLLNFVQLPMFDKSTLDNKERFRLVIAFSVFPLYKKTN